MEPTWHSLLPPLIAIGLAIVSRRVVLPLLAGILTGAFLLSRSATEDITLGQTASDTIRQFCLFLWDSMIDVSHLQVLTFSVLLGAMVGVLEHGGAMPALLQRIAKRIRARRGAQTLISVSGLAIFFDDYANTLLIGGAYRSMADRYRISRAKLAYLVDSTAAPMAGLALVSTWVATEISYLDEGLKNSGLEISSSAFELFLMSIPYRFYPWLALALVFIISITGRDFGPMLRAENASLSKSATHPPNTKDTPTDEDATPEEEPSLSTSWIRLIIAAIFPIVACVIAILMVLLLTGRGSEIPAEQSQSLGQLQSLGRIIGNGDSYIALVIGGAVGLVVAWAGALFLGHRSPRKLVQGSMSGAWQMMPAMLVLWLAWALSAMTVPEHLDAGGYLAGLLSNNLSPSFLPTVVFVLSGFVAFSTGTSWGTMAILTPLSVTLALQLDPQGGPQGAIHLATFSSVLAGAIFGDHCSPLSDTTVLSSRSCGCDHIEHVRTQMPYACLTAVVCILLGTLPAALGLSPWVCLLGGMAILLAVVLTFGQLASSNERVVPAVADKEAVADAEAIADTEKADSEQAHT